MAMMESMEELKAVQLKARPVINGVDDPSVMSIDSTTPITTDADEVNAADERGETTAAPKTAEEPKKADAPAKPAVASEVPKKDDHQKVEKRIGELTKKWRTAERELEFEKTQRQKLEEELTQLKSKVPDESRPKREDFDDDEAYQEALIDWKVATKLKAVEAKQTTSAQVDEEKTGVDEVYEIMDKMIETGREKYDDFDTVAMDKDLMITPAMSEVILESDAAAEIMYYLGQNPDIAADIAKLTPLKLVKKLSEIESEVTKGTVDTPTPKVEPPPTVKKKITAAPDPIDPVRETGAVEKDPNQMTPKEYRAWRERNKG